MKPEGTIGLHSVCQSVCLSVRHTRFPDFSLLCFHRSGWKLVASFYMKSYRSSSTLVTIDLLFHELLPFVQNSFSGHSSAMLSHIWMKVGSKLSYEELHVSIDLLFHELLPFAQNSFSELFSAMLSQISMTVRSKLPHKELQIKFDFRHSWPTFSWVIALSSKFVSSLFWAIYKWMEK